MIRKATLDDVEAIYAIAAENALKVGETQTGGFLVSKYPKSQYVEYVQSLRHFYVLVKEDAIVGFLFAYEANQLDQTLKVNQAMRRKAKNAFVVLKQICIAIKHQRQGHASSLYEDFMNRIEEDIYLSVVLEPYNAPSMLFHERLGFTMVHEVKENDGLLRGIFYWNNPKTTCMYNERVLLKQYQMAHDLYKHEDTLNWTKMNYLFYISASLIAVIVLSTSLPSAFGVPIGLMIAAVAGFITAQKFNVAIQSGVKYMHKRKKAYLHIEHLLEAIGGVPMANVLGDQEKSLYKKAPTEKILLTLPVLIKVLWLGVGLLGVGWLLFLILSNQ